MALDGAFAFADGSRVLFSQLLALSAPDGNQVWINVAKTGQWDGHPAGAFKFTADVFDRILSNAAGRSTPINCDYEHQTFRKGTTGPIPSSGQIVKLERRGDELWALVELTARAAQMVRDGEIRSCSPVIEFESKDRVSGKDIGPEMLSLALTNDPFQDGLHPIRLTRSADMADATTDDTKPKDDEKKDEPTKLADPQVTDDGAGADDSVDANSVFDAIAEAAGGDKAAVLAVFADNMEAIVKMVQDHLAKGDGNPSEGKAMSRITAVAGDMRALRIELKQSATEVRALTARLEKAESQLRTDADKAKAEKDSSVKAHVLSLQKTGHVGPKQEDIDDAVYLFSSDWARGERTYARQVVPLGEPDSKDERNPKAVTAVTMDNLSDLEKATVTALSGMNMAKPEQTRLLTLLREGKTATEAARTIAAERGGKAT